MSYDSTEETQKHIDRVRHYMIFTIKDLIKRADNHDASKLLSPEKEYFDKYTQELANLEYGTPEYKESCKKLKPAIDHHYSVNDHHAQFHGEEGINGMNLLSLVEMLCDWKASGERGKAGTGNIYKSIDINSERFGISKQLRKILINTAKYLKYE
jgi:hypothetical protein